ncbi:RNA 2',3'-cyclic phosphodiesterase [Heyndrickxia acidiproducens]|uniref:RNA 2',3'-cyclic phosphodiesterase n=1 Tax=Heyndrickxia acidiproducens TaxID=1121084 RepID=UPI0003645A3D|nr:RNA 2',3'-cyclic phosphodiesterase [Heyndrickxia acidiproducens]
MADHYFYAVYLEAPVKDELQEIMPGLKKTLPFTKWVHRDDWHITLAFLGAADEGQLAKTNRAIVEGTENYPCFSLTLDRLGTFGKKTEPRIFWAGTARSEPLLALQKKIYRHCMNAGFQLDKKPFNPHITLARKWRGNDPFHTTALENIIKTPVSFPVTRIVLYRTYPDRTPKYEIQRSFYLKGAEGKKF